MSSLALLQSIPCGQWITLHNCFLDIFETPVTVTPPTENFKNFKFFKNSQTILNVYFWGNLTFTFGDRAFTFGERAFTFGDNRGWGGFWEFIIFCCWGGLGPPWVGGPVGVFENI